MDAKKIVATYELDYVIAIERPGPAEDGGYYTMKGRDMSQSVGIAKLEQLLDLRVDSVSTYACVVRCPRLTSHILFSGEEWDALVEERGDWRWSVQLKFRRRATVLTMSVVL